MKRLAINILFILFFAGCVSSSPASSTATVNEKIETPAKPVNKSIVRLTNGDWIPYTGSDLTGYGCDSRVVAEVFSRIGYTVEYGFFPWARGFRLAETGEWDGMIEWADTAEARNAFHVSQYPISKQEYVFFHRKDHAFQWQTLDDLAGKEIGITTGYLYSDNFLNVINDKKYHFQEASTDEANFEKLLAGRIEIFPMERNVGLALLKAKFPPDQTSQLTFAQKPLSTFEPHVFLSKIDPDHQNLIREYDMEFEKFLKTQAYQGIADQCNLQ